MAGPTLVYYCSGHGELLLNTLDAACFSSDLRPHNAFSDVCARQKVSQALQLVCKPWRQIIKSMHRGTFGAERTIICTSADAPW